MQKPKIAVVGCGHWGKNLVRNYAELGFLHAIADINSKEAAHLAKIYNVTASSFTKILQSDINGIVIATPAAQHYNLVTKALEANKHVFVEKPLALNVSEAEKLCGLAKTKSKVLMVGHLLSYHTAFLQLKKLVQQGTLGRIQYVYSNRLNFGKIRDEENILWSFAPHDISMILSLVGNMPNKVFATGAAHLNSHIHDITTTHLSFENGIKAHIFVSWLHPFKEQKLIVVGDRGMAVFDDSLSWNEKLKLYPHQVNWINGIPQPEKACCSNIAIQEQEPLKAECQHFIECIKNNLDARTNGNEGLRVLRVLDAAQRSLNTAKTVCLKEDDDDNNTLPYFAHSTAQLDSGCIIGINTKIWHFSHIFPRANIGNNCIIGQNVMIGPNVTIGNNCKIQNNVSLYAGVTLEDEVFCGPSCVFTNVRTPRAYIERKSEFSPTHVERGVTIGANATIICGNRLGAYSLIGAGAVITKNVKPHAVMIGNPAKQVGWVSHAGERLTKDLICPREGRKYKVNTSNQLEELPKKDVCITEQD